MKRIFFFGMSMALSFFAVAGAGTPNIQGLIQKTDPHINLGMMVEPKFKEVLRPQLGLSYPVLKLCIDVVLSFSSD